MPNPTTDFKEGVPRKDLHVFYVLDTSGSMSGTKISTLNHAMEETIEVLKTEAKKNADAKLKIAVLEFNSGCKWITSNGPEDLEEDFEYEYLKAGGLTDIGSALKALNEKLSRHAFLNSMTGALMPVIIFMTDGNATDDYMKELEKIRRNKWFARAAKIGFALGDDADVAMISSVVGNCEAVLKTSNLELFKKLIKFVSVTSTMLQSESSTSETAAEGADIIKMGQQEGIIPEEAQVHIENDKYTPEPTTYSEPGNDTWDDEEW